MTAAIQEQASVHEQERMAIDAIVGLSGKQGFWGMGELATKARQGGTIDTMSGQFPELVFYALGFEEHRMHLDETDSPPPIHRMFWDIHPNAVDMNDQKLPLYRMGVYANRRGQAAVWEWASDSKNLLVRGRTNIPGSEFTRSQVIIGPEAITLQQYDIENKRFLLPPYEISLNRQSMAPLKQLANGLRSKFNTLQMLVQSAQEAQQRQDNPMGQAVGELVKECFLDRPERGGALATGPVTFIEIAPMKEHRDIYRIGQGMYRLPELSSDSLPLLISADGAIEHASKKFIVLRGPTLPNGLTQRVNINSVITGPSSVTMDRAISAGKTLDAYVMPMSVMPSVVEEYAGTVAKITELLRHAMPVKLTGSGG